MRSNDPNRAPDDRELVERARAGDERARGALVDRHHASVYRSALAVLRDEDMAADAAQDVFVKALRALDGFRGEASFRTWILTIAANEARSQLRRVSRRRETTLEAAASLASGDVGPDEGALSRVEAQRVRKQVAQLPEKQRMAVLLRVDEGLSFREVGEVIGSSEGAARVNYFHAIRRLREMLE